MELLIRAGLSSSKSEARRAIMGRGVRVNGEVVEDLDLVISDQNLPI